MLKLNPIFLSKFSKKYPTIVKPNFRFLSNSFSESSSSPIPPTTSSSYNQKEVENFSKQAGNFWDPNGDSKILHQMNSVRVPFIRQALQLQMKNSNLEYDYCFPLTNLKILDVGCGTGILSEPLSRLGADVVAIDASPEMINFAKQRQETTNRSDSNYEDIKAIGYLNTTIEDLRKNITSLESTFDLVVSSEVIEHVDNDSKFDFIENLNFFVDENNQGSLILSTMARNVKSWLVTVVAAEKILGHVPDGTHDLGKYIDSEELSHLITSLNNKNTKSQNLNGESNKLAIERIEGLFYNPLTQLWSFQNNLDVNYILHAKYLKV